MIPQWQLSPLMWRPTTVGKISRAATANSRVSTRGQCRAILRADPFQHVSLFHIPPPPPHTHTQPSATPHAPPPRAQRLPRLLLSLTHPPNHSLNYPPSASVRVFISTLACHLLSHTVTQYSTWMGPQWLTSCLISLKSGFANKNQCGYFSKQNKKSDRPVV